MKRIKYNLICIATLSVLSLTACRVSKQQTSEAIRYQTDSTRTVRQDSLHYRHLLRASAQMDVRLHHITLGKPDSLGRQYPLSITTAQWEQTRLLAHDDTLAWQTTRDARTHSNAYDVRHDNKATKRSNTFWLYLVVLLFLIGGSLYCLYRHRSRANSLRSGGQQKWE